MVLDEETYKVGEPFAKYFSLTNDEVYEIGLTPNVQMQCLIMVLQEIYTLFYLIMG
jgi:hypothetical protein